MSNQIRMTMTNDEATMTNGEGRCCGVCELPVRNGCKCTGADDGWHWDMTMETRTPGTDSKIVHCLWHILVVLVPHGVEALDDESLTQEEIQVTVEQLWGHGLSIYIW